MPKQQRYRLVPGPDVDLEREDIRDTKGARIDERYAQQAVEDVHKHLGRPSLTAPGARSPQVSFRVRAEVRDAAKARAERQGMSVSELAREALERYLAG